ncbi:MAG: alpha/beta hydrolase [Chloroherpetonaceae bacterium]|nr:alpha/beta hydrolase [Chloroherpetonaceae bacterium]
MSAPSEFLHVFEPGTERTPGWTFLMLHGTGGDENDLRDLGRYLAPDVAQLRPRGQVLERGMPRFFRRLAEGVFDLEDLIARTHALADFVLRAAEQYAFDTRRVMAVGYSNGANIAVSTLLLRSGVLAGAVLFHPMVPLVPEQPPDLHHVPIFIGAGTADPIVPAAQTEALAQMLAGYGARVTVHWQSGGHSLGQSEVEQARIWLAPLLAT